jgi:hypothetical protein
VRKKKEKRWDEGEEETAASFCEHKFTIMNLHIA